MWRFAAAVLTSALLTPPVPATFHGRDEVPLPKAALWSSSAILSDLLQTEPATLAASRAHFGNPFPAPAPAPRMQKGTRVALIVAAVGAGAFIWLYANCFYRCK